jgi:hypothetical protein
MVTLAATVLGRPNQVKRTVLGKPLIRPLCSVQEVQNIQGIAVNSHVLILLKEFIRVSILVLLITFARFKEHATFVATIVAHIRTYKPIDTVPRFGVKWQITHLYASIVSRTTELYGGSLLTHLANSARNAAA